MYPPKYGGDVPARARCMYCGGPVVEREVLVIGPEVADPVAAIKAKMDAMRASAAALPPHVRAARFEAAKQKINLLLDAGRDAETVAAIDEALALEPGAARLYIARGLCLGNLRQHAEALPCFRAAADLDPTLADAAYDRAISIDPNHAQAWCDRGHTLNRLNRRADALASFETALAINPRLAVAWFNKAGAEIEAGRPADAAQSLERFIAVADPREHAATIQRARGMLAQLRA